MAISIATARTEIAKLYIAAFNRVPDSDGLAFWVDSYVNQGRTLDQIAQNFTESTEYASTYPAYQTTAEYVEAVYVNVFGRASDAEGKAYWVARLETASTAADYLSHGTLMNAMVAAADANGSSDGDRLDNQASFAVQSVLDEVPTATATAQLANITSNAATVTAATAAVAGTTGASTGSTYTLTTNTDVITGTSGNDTIIADAANTVVSDQVNGGTGTDTIKIYSPAGAADIPTISNVEIFELIDSTATTDLSAVTALTSLTLDNSSTGLTYTTVPAATVTLKGMADGEAITLVTTATDTAHDISVTNMGTIAGAGVTVNADGAAVTTLNLTATGSVAAGTDSDITLASTGLETTINVSGSGDLALTTAATTVTTFGASAYTGNLTLVTGANTTATAITTGSGNDTVTATAAVNYTIDLGAGNDTLITADAAGELTTSDAIVGGAGTDTFGIASGEAENLDDGVAADTAILAKVTGFEQLRITDALAGDLAMNNLGYNYLQVTTDIAADRTLTGVTSGFTLESRLDAATSADYVITMTGATGAGTNSDTINLNLNADLATNDAMRAISFDLAGINIVNISANDRDTTSNPDTDANGDEGYTVDLAGNQAGNNNSANITTVNVTGAKKVGYTVHADTVALTTYDASAATGEQLFTAAAFAGTQGVTIKGGSAGDSLTGSGLADVIDGGAGNDTIVGGVGADSMTGGAGVDTFTFANSATGLPTSTNFDTITDFAKASDIIDGPGALTLSVNAAAATAGTASINAEGIATFAAADDTLAEMITAVQAGLEIATATTANDFAVFEFSGSTYVFITDATAAVSATDVLVKLTGVTGITDTTISGGDVTLA